MKKMIRFLGFYSCLILFFAFIPANSGQKPDFSLQSLEGEWIGAGDAIIPNIRLPITINGTATFSYDSFGNYLRTSIKAQKLFFTYSDSGHLYYNEKNDSIMWEIWDGFGDFGIYYGHVEDNRLHGVLTQDKWLFSIDIEFVTTDSMVFNMVTQKGAEGKEKPVTTINLWREK